MTTATATKFYLRDLDTFMYRLKDTMIFEGHYDTITLRWYPSGKSREWTAWYTERPNVVAINAATAQQALDRLRTLVDRGSGR